MIGMRKSCKSELNGIQNELGPTDVVLIIITMMHYAPMIFECFGDWLARQCFLWSCVSAKKGCWGHLSVVFEIWTGESQA
jgi:hypothetical protein